MKRRTWMKVATAAAVGAALPSIAAGADVMQVYKSPACGCCGDWVKHVEANGFRVVVHDVGNNAARARLGIPLALGGCHTGEIAGYAIEGHVPAADIRRLLAARPKARGLAVPGMPIGSPGMEQGGKQEAYDVLLVRNDGSTTVYASYRAS